METGFPSADWAIESPAALLANFARSSSALSNEGTNRYGEEDQRSSDALPALDDLHPPAADAGAWAVLGLPVAIFPGAP